MISLEQMSQFLAAADSLSFSKAAQKLYLSHSTIIRSVSAMEQDLGVPLFVRSRRGLVLTASGRELMARAKSLLQQMQELESAVQQAGGRTMQQVKIASINVFCPGVYEAYRQFRQESPDCNLDISSVPPGDVLAAVTQGKADVGIAYSFEIDSSQDFKIVPVERGHFCAVVSENHPLAGRESISAKDIRPFTPIMLQGQQGPVLSAIRRSFTPDSGPEPRTIMASSLDEMLMRVKADIGIAIVPEHAAAEAGAGCRAIRLPQLAAGYEIVMFAVRQNLSPAAEKLMDILQKKED